MKKRNAKTWIVRGILWLLISVILGGAVYSFNAKRVLGEELPMPFGIGSSIVLSGSMEPRLSVDDLVLIKKSKTYAVGDVVVYRGETSLVIHRIVRMDEDAVVTRGDANNTDDAPISKEAIKGKLILSIPHVGPIVNFLRSPAGTILLIAVAVVLLMLSSDGEKKKDRDELNRIREEIDALKYDTPQE